MTFLYPLRFKPIFRQYLWGGRRLGTILGKPIGEGNDYAESWEVVDRGDDQSVIAAGPLAGTSLGEIVQSRGADLLGRHHPQARFPLLFKLLDANVQLSVQVHPNDAQAAKVHPLELGKTEAWVILAAEPGSYIYAGLRRGVERAALEREISRGSCELCLHKLEPQPGDCIFLPAGTVHALGPGLLVAEIQQSSDVTYRLYDWNRRGADGKTRSLHIEQALEVIDFNSPPVTPQEPLSTERSHIERLVICDKFVLDRWRISAPETIGGDNRCHIIAVLSGELQIENDPMNTSLKAGDVALLPANVGSALLTPSCPTVLLDAYLP